MPVWQAAIRSKTSVVPPLRVCWRRTCGHLDQSSRLSKRLSGKSDEIAYSRNVKDLEDRVACLKRSLSYHGMKLRRSLFGAFTSDRQKSSTLTASVVDIARTAFAGGGPSFACRPLVTRGDLILGSCHSSTSFGLQSDLQTLEVALRALTSSLSRIKEAMALRISLDRDPDDAPMTARSIRTPLDLLLRMHAGLGMVSLALRAVRNPTNGCSQRLSTNQRL